MSNTVYLELSNTFIYRRIARAIGLNLATCGFDVFTIDPKAFNVDSYKQFLASTGDSIYISNSVNNAIQQKVADSEEFFFESFKGRIIFIHQDAILGGSEILDAIAKLKGWSRVAHRSAHLCIDPIDVSQLQSIGTGNAHLVTHATEIMPRDALADGFRYQSNFVGHVVPSAYQPIHSSPKTQALIANAVQRRKSDFAAPLSPLIAEHTSGIVEGIGNAADQAILTVACAQWLRSRVTDQTLPLRGWVFENFGGSTLDIFGGDPAPLHGVERSLKIENDRITYHPAVFDPQDVSNIYNASQISINVSSLQFDHALVNRFHDVVMSGGLCITDAKPGLAELTTAHADVSFNNLPELQERVSYFSRPENSHIRSTLVRQLQADITKNSGYDRLTASIKFALSKLA
jgi:hypothetical protein